MAGAPYRKAHHALVIGPSALHWDGNALTVSINEITTPWARALRGVVRLYPSAVLSGSYALDATGRHHWCPMAPCARVEVDLSQPALRWRGSDYLDSNRGDRPLEHDLKVGTGRARRCRSNAPPCCTTPRVATAAP